MEFHFRLISFADFTTFILQSSNSIVSNYCYYIKIHAASFQFRFDSWISVWFHLRQWNKLQFWMQNKPEWNWNQPHWIHLVSLFHGQSIGIMHHSSTAMAAFIHLSSFSIPFQLLNSLFAYSLISFFLLNFFIPSFRNWKFLLFVNRTILLDYF